MALKWPEEIVIYLVDKIIWHFLLPDDASILLPDRLYFNVINRPMYNGLKIEKCLSFFLHSAGKPLQSCSVRIFL